jgi:hypothetical protein
MQCSPKIEGLFNYEVNKIIMWIMDPASLIVKYGWTGILPVFFVFLR